MIGSWLMQRVWITAHGILFASIPVRPSKQFKAQSKSHAIRQIDGERASQLCQKLILVMSLLEKAKVVKCDAMWLIPVSHHYNC